MVGIHLSPLSWEGLCPQILISYAIWRYRLFNLTPATSAEAILSTMPSSLILIDSENKIQIINDATMALLGYEQKQLIGESIECIFKGDSSRILQKDAYNELLTKKHINKVETTITSKDGRTIPVELSTSLMNGKDGKLIGTIYIFRDITKQNKSNAEIDNKSKELQSKVGELERFNKLIIGRELRMIELKSKINSLEEGLHKEREAKE